VRPAPRAVPRARPDLRTILRRVGWGVLALALTLLMVTIVVQQQVARAVALRDVRDNRPVAKPLVTPMNILLAGVDLRPDHPEEGIRSDSLLLLRLDPLGGWANLLAIPRDSVAAVPGFGEDKINAAFQHGYASPERYGAGTKPFEGGAALAAETAQQFLGLRELGARIDYVATIDFDGFAAMIDALGGIDVDVPRPIVDNAYPTPDFGVTTIEFKAGPQRMDGARALQYVRTRHADSDFGRTERQQQVIHAMTSSLRERSLPFKAIAAYRLLRATGKAIHTTLPVGRPDALLLGALLMRIDQGDIGSYRITPDTAQLVAEEGSNLRWDPGSVQKLAQQALARTGEAQEKAVVLVRNTTEEPGLATRVSQTLGENGFTTTTPDNGEDLASRSVILDFTGKPRTRERLRQTLGGIRVETRPPSEAPSGVDLVVVLGEDYARYVPVQ
jgi:LCP family protein required for cell wall assembly